MIERVDKTRSSTLGSRLLARLRHYYYLILHNTLRAVDTVVVVVVFDQPETLFFDCTPNDPQCAIALRGRLFCLLQKRRVISAIRSVYDHCERCVKFLSEPGNKTRAIAAYLYILCLWYDVWSCARCLAFMRRYNVFAFTKLNTSSHTKYDYAYFKDLISQMGNCMMQNALKMMWTIEQMLV